MLILVIISNNNNPRYFLSYEASKIFHDISMNYELRSMTIDLKLVKNWLRIGKRPDLSRGSVHLSKFLCLEIILQIRAFDLKHTYSFLR